MGYTTNFSGKFNVEPRVSESHATYINKFAETRRMKRDSQKAMELEDPVRLAVGLPIGLEGDYFVGGSGLAGQDRDASVINHNDPPDTQPGLWCQWVINEQCDALEWDGGEKFYHYVQWLEYVIERFLDPWGYKLNGIVHWQGEDPSDIGTISVQNNEIEVTEHTWGQQPEGFPFIPDPYGYENDEEEEEYDRPMVEAWASVPISIVPSDDVVIELPRGAADALRVILQQLLTHPDDLPNPNDVELCRFLIGRIEDQLNEE